MCVIHLIHVSFGYTVVPKARGRLPRKLKKVAGDPEAVQARIRSFAALWCFPFRP